MSDNPKHHSAEQPRGDAGQWRQPVGPFDHAGVVPGSIEVVNVMVPPGVPYPSGEDLRRIESDINKALAMPAPLSRSR